MYRLAAKRSKYQRSAKKLQETEGINKLLTGIKSTCKQAPRLTDIPDNALTYTILHTQHNRLS